MEFPTDTGADNAIRILEELQGEQLITVHDAAIVSWSEGAKKPKTRQLHSLAGPGALEARSGACCSICCSSSPFSAPRSERASVMLGGAFARIGIDDHFIARLKDQVTPATSAPFVLTSDATLDRVHERFAGHHVELISTNLNADQET